MKASIHGRGGLRRVNPDWFTGRTWMKELSGRLGSPRQDVYHVHFVGGSRTRLHSHDGDQLLITTAGRGSLETFGRTGAGRPPFAISRTGRTALAEGDVVHIPAGTLHTHGSTGPDEFSHIAINVRRGRGPYRTVWYESDAGSRVTGTIGG